METVLLQDHSLSTNHYHLIQYIEIHAWSLLILQYVVHSIYKLVNAIIAYIILLRGEIMNLCKLAATLCILYGRRIRSIDI